MKTTKNLSVKEMYAELINDVLKEATEERTIYLYYFISKMIKHDKQEAKQPLQ